MGASDERGDALRLIEGLEGGRMTATDAAALAERIDPVLVYVAVSYLRAIHPASDPVAGAVLERVARMTAASPTLVRRHREGEQDPIARWFESDYAYRDFRGRAPDLVDLILDKIES